MVKPRDEALIVPYIDIDLPEGGMTKNQIMMLDILTGVKKVLLKWDLIVVGKHHAAPLTIEKR